MGQLIGLLKPLLIVMVAAILLGTIGYLCAIFLTILAEQVVKHGLIPVLFYRMRNTRLVFIPVKTIMTTMIIIALLREFSTILNNTVITVSHLDYWLLLAIRYLQHYRSSALQNWNLVIKEILFPSLQQI